jgi:hypothetical protein
MRNAVDRVIRRNAFFAHPENVLLSMLADNDDIRNIAIERISTARCRTQPNTVRQFVIPIINLNASSYVDMVDWDSVSSTERSAN